MKRYIRSSSSLSAYDYYFKKLKYYVNENYLNKISDTIRWKFKREVDDDPEDSIVFLWLGANPNEDWWPYGTRSTSAFVFSIGVYVDRESKLIKGIYVQVPESKMHYVGLMSSSPEMIKDTALNVDFDHLDSLPDFSSKVAVEAKQFLMKYFGDVV